MKLKDFSETKKSALRLLARRDYGFYELKQRLRTKGFEEPIIDQVLETLVESGLQSDARFVASYVRRRMAKGFGPLHIANELLKLHLAEELIQKGIREYEAEWLLVIKQLYYKKFGAPACTSDLKQHAKQVRFFQSRGFNFSQIKAALINE